MNRTQENRRTESIWNKVKKMANEENIDVSKILGLLLTRCESVKLKHIGPKILNGDLEDEQKKEIPTITALTIYCDCNLGKETLRNSVVC